MPLDSGANTLFYQAYHTSLTQTKSLWDIRAGGSFFAGYNDVNTQLGLTNLYVHLRRYGFRLSIGRYYEEIGFGAPHLSTGKMMVSRNARPPWRIGFYTDGYLEVPKTAGILSIKARWSEGLFLEDRFIQNANLHQKYAYIKIQPVSAFALEAGFVHNLVWGGRHPERGLMHRSFADYLDDVLGRADTPSVTPLGNGVLGYDGGITYRPKGAKGPELGFGRLFYVESGDNLRFRSPWDGLWSGWMQLPQPDTGFRFLDYVMYEHLNTKRQDALKADLRGRGRYYTHDTWRDGWVHHSHVLGNALLTLEPELLTTGERAVVNNMVIAHHIGLKGKLSKRMSWESAFTYSRNYGDCSDQLPGIRSCHGRNGTMLREREDYIPIGELRKDRYSFYVGVSYDVAPKEFKQYGLHNLRLRASLAHDTGSFYRTSRTGAEIGFTSYF